MKIIGHRGARGLAPENTLESIEAALTYHVDEVEVDVRVTQDAVPVLAHDATVTIDGSTVLIAALTLDELWAIHPNIATLAEALKVIHPHAVAHLEVKPAEPVEPIAEVIRECLTSGDYTLDGIVLASKNQKTLLALHQELPELTTVVIESWSSIRARRRAAQLNTKRLSMRASWLWSGFLRAMHAGGYQITPYTVNDPKIAKKWNRHIAGVVTDFPDRFDV